MGFLNFTSCFAFLGPINGRVRIHFFSLGSYLKMLHGYASLKKEHILPVFTEKRALFQHILRDAKSTKCELKEHLWERATCSGRIGARNGSPDS